MAKNLNNSNDAGQLEPPVTRQFKFRAWDVQKNVNKMKYIIPTFFFAAIIVGILVVNLAYIERGYHQTLQDNLRTQIAITDSLQAIVDNCDARVNDMRLQRDHAIEVNRWHEQRRNEMIRVRPE